MQWYLKVLRQYADFSGRARRREYWMFTLVNAIVGFALSILDTILQLQLGTGGVSDGSGVLSSIYGLATLVPSLAVGARRLHDIDRTGWWQVLPVAPFLLVFVLIPFVAAEPPPTVAIVALVVVLISVFVAAIVLLVWTVTEGKPGGNRFGPNPKEPFPAPPSPHVW